MGASWTVANMFFKKGLREEEDHFISQYQVCLFVCLFRDYFIIAAETYTIQSVSFSSLAMKSIGIYQPNYICLSI